VNDQPQPVVSVCMSAYNTEEFVAAAIESVLGQSLVDVEVVVLDNASSDGTWERIQAVSDPRVRSIRVERNLGASGGRAFAIEHARGVWVAVLDSDDWMDANRLERLVKLGDAEGADIVADDVHLIDDGAAVPWGTLFTSRVDQPVPRTIDATAFVASDRWLQPGLRLGLTKPLFRRSFLVQHPTLRPDPRLTVVHDFWWVLECLLAGASMVLTPEAGYYYRAREGQLVTSGVELITLEQQIDMVTRTLARPEVRADPHLRAALEESRQGWERANAYMGFLGALRAHHVGDAARIARSHPRVLVTLARNLPSWLRRRLARDRFASHMTRRF